MINRQSQRFERRLGREIARAMRAAATALRSGSISPADSIREKHQANVDRLLNTVWSQSLSEMVEHMFGVQRSWAGKIEVKQQGLDVNPTELADRIQSDWVAQIGGLKIKQITQTTLEDVRRAIERGIEEGQSEREIATAIEALAPTKSASRAQTIARTETHAASQFAAQKSAEATGLNMVRVWVSSKGERTRTLAEGAAFDHLAADGQKRGMNEPFNIPSQFGSEAIMYPGDPNGSAGNVINCRCAVVFELE